MHRRSERTKRTDGGPGGKARNALVPPFAHEQPMNEDARGLASRRYGRDQGYVGDGRNVSNPVIYVPDLPIRCLEETSCGDRVRDRPHAVA